MVKAVCRGKFKLNLSKTLGFKLTWHILNNNHQMTNDILRHNKDVLMFHLFYTLVFDEYGRSIHQRILESYTSCIYNISTTC